MIIIISILITISVVSLKSKWLIMHYQFDTSLVSTCVLFRTTYTCRWGNKDHTPEFFMRVHVITS